MDGKLTTPAALNGDVRTIPLIDKTLTIEGTCADAKATGDRFGAQAAIIEEHGRKIADNAAAIQRLSAENGVQDTTLGEHKALIDGNATKIAAAENNIGELHRKATEATDAIGDMNEQVETNKQAIAELESAVKANESTISNIGDAVSNRVFPELAEAKNDIEVLKADVDDLQHGFDKTSGDIQHFYYDPLIERNNSFYAVSCGVCTAWLNFVTLNEISHATVLLEGLPVPKAAGLFSACDVNTGKAYVFRLEANNQDGRILANATLPGQGHFVGNVAYVVADAV